MYSGLGSQTQMENYHDQIVSNIHQFKKTLTVYPDTNVHGSTLIEISYVKDKGIRVRNLYIHKDNLVEIIFKFKEQGFIINNKSTKQSKISNFDQIPAGQLHPEYSNTDISNFNRQAFNNSFNEKFKYLNK
jgi:hypothetical protein